ncbi:hypothetical protein [Cellulomonas sp. PhB143]|uniref:hypothetical protein n=1 Tax=Cellulomonas sp. PhB143 TaxID=2485186 RepID=UPI000FA36234|nr:hypothetical protein [Cellulomonas sp. PhB143]ROS73591.1 hypothetical protein EDF32_2443 [Cellulomonas sp. PhB143]
MEDTVLAAALTVAEKAAEPVVNELPMPPIVFGILAFAGLCTLLLVAYAFRSIGTRH